MGVIRVQICCSLGAWDRERGAGVRAPLAPVSSFFSSYKGKPTIFSKNVLPFPEMAQRFTPSHSDYPLSSPGPPAPSPAPFWGKGSPAGSTTERSLMFCFCFTFLHQESGQHPKIQKQKSLSGGRRSARENSTKPNHQKPLGLLSQLSTAI